MEVVYPRCCGLDVHKKSVTACAVVAGPAGAAARTLRVFGTMTQDLRELAAWLAAQGVTHVAMESTGVYWKPIWDTLEAAGGFGLLLVNAGHIKQVPGRKTDVRDAEWLADLLRHGLLRASFVPDRAQRELRELTRYRTALVRERATEVNRLQKTLEGGNIKLAAVASDVAGTSGRAMLAALVGGADDPAALADLALRRLRAKLPELARALEGDFGPHQRFLVARQLAHLDFLEAEVARLDAEVAARLRPYEAELARLDTLPGIGRRTAEVILAELGPDLTRFASARHLASWAGMCPGNRESAGKRLSGKTRKGNKWLRAALVEAAHGAARTKGTYLAAQYRRLAARRGKKRAAVAVGHSLLTIIYHVLTEGTAYRDLGPTYFDARDRSAVERRLVGRLEALGHRVVLEPRPPAGPPAPARPDDAQQLPVAV
jgi:transposase